MANFPLYKGYADNVKQWKALLLAYHGGAEYKKTFLIQYFGETDDAFKERSTRAFYLNYCKQVINTLITYLFSQSDNIHLKLPGAIEYLIDDCDTFGTSLIDYIKANLVQALTLGQMGVLVDTPLQPKPDDSAATQKALGRRFYLVPVYPWQMINFHQVNSVYKWLALEDEQVDYPNPFATRLSNKIYKVYYEDRVEVFNDQLSLINTVRLPYGKPPITWIMPKDVNADGFGESCITDIHDINVNIFNLTTMLNRSTMEIMAPKLLVPEDSVRDNEDDYFTGLDEVGLDRPAREQVKAKLITALGSVWEYNPFTTSPDKPMKPEYLEHSTGIISAIMQAVEMLRVEILRISGLNSPGMIETGGAPASGLSKMVDFIDTNNTLGSIANVVSYQWEGFLRTIAKASGADPDEVIVDFPTDYNVSSLDALITNLITWKDSVDSDLYAINVEKLIVRKTLGRYYSDDEIGLILKEVEGEPNATRTNTTNNTEPTGNETGGDETTGDKTTRDNTAT